MINISSGYEVHGTGHSLLLALYIFTFWLHNYAGYIETGQTSTLNGRYLLTVLPPLLAVLGQEARRLFGPVVR